jgi:hypothetical protein
MRSLAVKYVANDGKGMTASAEARSTITASVHG